MKTFGLTGYPLSHSFSPKYFEEKFKREKITEAEYKLFPLKRIKELPQLIKKNPALCGLNVTIPYKESVIPFLDELDETAKKVGAVNTICLTPQPPLLLERGSKRMRLVGYNTDVFGFEKSLKKYLKPHHKKALILGTGGASKAAKYVLKKLKIEFLFVSRSKLPASGILYPDIDKKIIEEFTLIINTTPIGMHPNENKCPPLPYQFITSQHLLFDLIYNPAKTMFMKKGKEKNAIVVNGLETLQLQAEKSWEIWKIHQ